MIPSSKKTLTVKYVFIGSPGDLAKERQMFPGILRKVNELKANALGIELRPLGWEDTLPGFGRPQGLINEDVKKADLCVMLLWKRWGTPTGKYSSGLEEEYELVRALHKKDGRPDTWLFFRTVRPEMMADPGVQLIQVLAFRKNVEEARTCFFKHYDEPQKWQETLVGYLCDWLDKSFPGPPQGRIEFPPEAHKRIQDLETDLARIDEAHAAAQDKLRKLALELTQQGVRAAEKGLLTEAEQAFASAVEAYPEPAAINSFGIFLSKTGSLDRAIEKFSQLEGLAEQFSDNSISAIAYGNLGNIYATRGDLDKAEEMYRMALAIHQELGGKEGMAIAYGNLGIISTTKGDLDKAEELHRKALAIHQEVGGKKGMANAYGNLGNISTTRGDLDKAEEMYRKALAIHQEVGGKKGMANAYGNLGNISTTRGDLDKAEEMYRKALAIDQELGGKEGMAIAYGNLGIIYRSRGDLDKAEEMHRKALAINQELGSKDGMAIAYGNLGIIYSQRGDSRGARRMYKKASRLFKQIGATPGIERMQKLLAQLTTKE